MDREDRRAIGALHFDRSAMGTDDRVRDVESESEPFTHRWSGDAMERFEELRDAFLRDRSATVLVANLDRDIGIVGAYVEPDRSRRCAMNDRVPDQIGHR